MDTLLQTFLRPTSIAIALVAMHSAPAVCYHATSLGDRSKVELNFNSQSDHNDHVRLIL